MKTIGKRLLSATLVLVIVLSLLPAAASQADGSPEFLSDIIVDVTSIDYISADTDFLADVRSRYNTDSDFFVESAGELAAIAKLVNEELFDFEGKTITITADIDLGGNGLVEYKSEPNSDGAYTLTYSGEVMNAWTPIGKFESAFKGTLDGDGFEITNMVVVEESSSEIVYAGLFGYVGFSGTIVSLAIGEDCTVIALATNYRAYAGGIVGEMSYGNISNCSNDTTVSSSSMAGGIAGITTYSDIGECANAGVISSVASSFADAGGITGNSHFGNISDCSNTGAISSYSSTFSSNASGITGVSSGDISNCSNTGNISSIAFGTYGTTLASGITYSNDGSVFSCTNTGNISSIASRNAYAGGIVGYGENLSNCLNTGSIFSSASGSASHATAGGIAGSSERIISCSNTGDVSASGLLYTYAGGIVGACGSIIRGCINSGAVSSSGSGVFSLACAGGISGRSGGDISHSNNTGDVSSSGSNNSSEAFAGGISGYANRKISNCYNTGDISSSTSNFISYSVAGGIAGDGNIISNCYNTGVVSSSVSNTSSNAFMGGIAGQTYFGNISHCYNTGTGSSYASGIATSAAAGGIVGANNSGSISYCYNIGDISTNALTGNRGAIVGYGDAPSDNCYFQYRVNNDPYSNHSELQSGLFTSDYRTIPAKDGGPGITVFDETGGDIDKIWYFSNTGTGVHPLLHTFDYSVKKLLVSIIKPATINGVANGFTKTELNNILPALVIMITDDGNIEAEVIWSVNGCSYDPTLTTAQTFTVDGAVLILPDGVINTNDVSQSVQITVTVDAVEYTGKVLVSITEPAAVTGLANGITKAALTDKLPATVIIETDDDSVEADVIWDVDGSGYDPSKTTAQAFTVSGEVMLPVDVANPNNAVSQTIQIIVTVDAVEYTGKALVSITEPAAVTGLANGMAKTALADRLPTTVTIQTDEGAVIVGVVWDIDGSSYNPATTTAQTFIVNGIITLPIDVLNTNNTSLTVPISVTVDAATQYAATVKDGTGGGNYTAGTTVNITANAAPDGQEFDRWTTGDGVIFDDEANAATSFTMPTKAVTVTATYKAVSISTYLVTVSHGTGGGNYAAGTTVNITANAAPDGQEFDRWTTGDGVTFVNEANAATSFTMPMKSVTVTATYKLSGTGGDGDDGSGGGSVGGGGGLTGPTAPNVPASLDESTGTFDKMVGSTNNKNISVTMTPGSAILTQIKIGNTALKEGVDYTKNGDTYTLIKEYLETLDNGKHTIIFDMNTGTDPSIEITIRGTGRAGSKPDTPKGNTEADQEAGAWANQKPVAGAFLFIDIPEDAWFRKDVETAYRLGLINGKSDALYAPEDNITFAEAVKLAACLHQLYHDGTVMLEVGAANWYSTYMDYALENSIISTDFSDRADEIISRAEFVNIFYGALPTSEYSGINEVADDAIPDVKSTYLYANRIYTFYRAGILVGSDEQGTFNPESNIARSEVAAILTRMYSSETRRLIKLI